MTDNWALQISHINKIENIGNIVYIGAGNGEALEVCLETQADNIILSEPDANLLSYLRGKARSDNRITVFPAAITEATGQATFYLLNFSSLSSMHRPQGLYELFPGLKLVGEAVVDTLGVEDFLRDALPESGVATHVLIINAPGSECTILKALLSSDYSAYFKHIAVRTTWAPLYEGSGALDELKKLVGGKYELQSQSMEDKDFTTLWFKNDPVQQENSRLIGQIQAANRQLAEEKAAAETIISDLQTRLAASEAALKERAKQYDLAIQEKLSDAKVAAEVATSDLQARLAASEASLKEVTGQYDLAMQERAQLAEEKAAAETIVSDLQTRLAASEASLKEVTGQYDLVMQERAQLTEEKVVAERAIKEAADKAKQQENVILELNGFLEEQKNTTASQLSEIEAQKKQISDLVKQSDSRQNRISELEAEMQELKFKRTLSVDELRRLEGQVDLIKELLLRGETL